MKIIYTNISPITNAYTNINHIFYLKKQKPQKVYICIWDNFVYEHPVFEKSLNTTTNKTEKLQENVKIIEKLLSYLKIDYKIIFLSEAMNRLFKNPTYLSEFQSILSQIRIEELKKGFALEYIPFDKISLSKINYIIADYLLATYLPELFPELCSSAPNNYLTSERFRAFHNKINQYLKTHFSKHIPPKTIFVKGVPVIIHPKKEIIPSLEMSVETIKKVTESHYLKLPQIKEFYDLIEVLSAVLHNYKFKNRKLKKGEVESIFKKLKYKDFIEFISENFYEYFAKIRNITSKIEIEKQKKTLFISNYHEFNACLKPLNNIKFKILKNCNGNNSSLDISRKTGLNLSTVSTYLAHLRAKKLISSSRRPRRLIDSFVIDLEAIEDDS